VHALTVLVDALDKGGDDLDVKLARPAVVQLTARLSARLEALSLRAAGTVPIAWRWPDG
jgi:hypothetical protein